MSIKLSARDHDSLDKLLNDVMTMHKADAIDLAQARSVFAHFFTAAAIQNETEVRAWLKPETLQNWKKDSGIQ